MLEVSLERRFRLLHSWRAKAEKLLEQHPTVQDKQAGRLRKTAERASVELENARRQEQTRLEELADALRKQLDVLSASGTIRLDAPAPPSENTPSERSPIEAIRQEIARYNNVLAASSADELGGFLDLPIEEYPVALGLRRSAGTQLSPFASTPKRVIIAAVAAAMFGILGTLAYIQSAKAVKVRIDAPLDGVVTMHILNQTSDTLAFWIPLEEQRSSPAHSFVHFGLHIWGRSPGEERPSLLPIATKHWQVPGSPGQPTLPLSVGPGLSLTIDVYVQQIRVDYGPFEEMTLRCVDDDGNTIGEAHYQLPTPS